MFYSKFFYEDFIYILFSFSSLTIVRIMGFQENVLFIILNGGKIQDGRHLCKV